MGGRTPGRAPHRRGRQPWSFWPPSARSPTSRAIEHRRRSGPSGRPGGLRGAGGGASWPRRPIGRRGRSSPPPRTSTRRRRRPSRAWSGATARASWGRGPGTTPRCPGLSWASTPRPRSRSVSFRAWVGEELVSGLARVALAGLYRRSGETDRAVEAYRGVVSSPDSSRSPGLRAALSGRHPRGRRALPEARAAYRSWSGVPGQRVHAGRASPRRLPANRHRDRFRGLRAVKKRTAWVLAAGVAAVALGAAAVGVVALLVRGGGQAPIGWSGRAPTSTLDVSGGLPERPAANWSELLRNASSFPAGHRREHRPGRPGRAGQGARAARRTPDRGLGAGPGAARRPRPLPVDRQAVVGPPRVRREPRVLPGHRLRANRRRTHRVAERLRAGGGGDVLPWDPGQGRGAGPVRGRREVQERPEPVHGDRLHRAPPGADGVAGGQPVRPVRDGGGREPGARGGAGSADHRRGALRRRGRQRPWAWWTSCSIADEGRGPRARRRAAWRWRATSASARGFGFDRRPKIGAGLCDRRHHAGRERPPAPSGASSFAGADTISRGLRQAARGRQHPRHRAAGGQPGRRGDGRGRGVAGGRPGAGQQAGDRLDGGRRRLGRVLHRDERRRDHGPAGDDDRLDRGLLRASSACGGLYEKLGDVPRDDSARAPRRRYSPAGSPGPRRSGPRSAA